MTQRESVLLELLVEVTQPKTDAPTEEATPPPAWALFNTGGILSPQQAAQLRSSLDHWKSVAERQAQTIRELHEELQRARSGAEPEEDKLRGLMP